MIDIIYYAHSMEIYGGEQEKCEQDMLNDSFREGVIYSPNRTFIQHHSEPMNACIDVVKDESITALAFSCHGRYISAGVLFEAKVAQKKGIPIYIITDEVTRYTGDFEELKKPSMKLKKPSRKRRRR